MLRPAILGSLLVCAGCALTRSLVYHPTPVLEPSPPIEAGSEAEPAAVDLRFAAEDGTVLHGRLARFVGAQRAVLFCHGNRGNVFTPYNEDTQRALRRATRAHVLVWDYRGYGCSEGRPREKLVQGDALAALAALESATAIARSEIVVVGQSLGGAVAIDLASRTRLRGLVVLSSFTNVNDMASFAARLPLGFLVPESWDSLEKVARIDGPKLFVHGDADDVIPFEQGERLFAAAKEPKQFLRLHNADQFPSLYRDSEVVAAIASFVNR